MPPAVASGITASTTFSISELQARLQDCSQRIVSATPQVTPAMIRDSMTLGTFIAQYQSEVATTDIGMAIARSRELVAKYQQNLQVLGKLKEIIDAFNANQAVLISAMANVQNSSNRSTTGKSTSGSIITNETIMKFFGSIGNGFKTMGSGIETGFRKFGGLFH